MAVRRPEGWWGHADLGHVVPGRALKHLPCCHTLHCTHNFCSTDAASDQTCCPDVTNSITGPAVSVHCQRAYRCPMRSNTFYDTIHWPLELHLARRLTRPRGTGLHGGVLAAVIIIIIVAVCVGALGTGLFMWCRMRIRKRAAMKVRKGRCTGYKPAVAPLLDGRACGAWSIRAGGDRSMHAAFSLAAGLLSHTCHEARACAEPGSVTVSGFQAVEGELKRARTTDSSTGCTASTPHWSDGLPGHKSWCHSSSPAPPPTKHQSAHPGLTLCGLSD